MVIRKTRRQRSPTRSDNKCFKSTQNVEELANESR